MSRISIATFEARPEITEGDRLFVEELPREVSVEAHPWGDPTVDWSRFDAVILRSTWDYHLRCEEFLQWIDRVSDLAVPVWNPRSLVRWNADKRYLKKLQDQGFETAPTEWVARGSDAALHEIAKRRKWDGLVVKPSISASAHETWRVHGAPAKSDETRFRALTGSQDVLVQPFLDEVVEHGEWSILVFGGRYSHAVLKRPAVGDFRVQKEFGGATSTDQPSARTLTTAQELVDSLPEVPLYARVDGIERGGRFLLIELELIEPDLFLEFSPDAPRALAAALAHRLHAL